MRARYISPAVARLTETQQLDDRIRSVVKALKLGEPHAPAPGHPTVPGGPSGPVHDITTDGEAPDVEPTEVPTAHPGRGRSRNLPKTKDEWLKLIASFAAADPTGDRGTYLLWITKQVLKRNLVFPEDMDKAKEALALFNTQKLKGGFKGDKNIDTYKKFADLYNTTQANLDVKTKTDLATEGAEVVCEGPVVSRDRKTKVETPLGIGRVVRVMTPEAGAKLFRRANWCVKDPKFFLSSSYSPPYYMVELKKIGSDNFDAMFLHDRKSMSLKRNDDTDAELKDIRPFAPLLKEAGMLDDKRGLAMVLGTTHVRENRPLAYLSVIMSDDRELIKQAHAHIHSQIPD